MSGQQHQVVGIGIGIAVSHILMETTGQELAAFAAVGSAIGVWWPDMDHDRTKLGRKRKFITSTVNNTFNFLMYGAIAIVTVLITAMVLGLIQTGLDTTRLFILGAMLIGTMIIKSAIANSKSYKWATKHRGLMHTLVMPGILLGLTTVSESALYHYFVFGLAVGYLSHLLGDILTEEGCPIFFPLPLGNFRIPILTNDKTRTVGAWTIAIGSVVASFKLI